MGRKVDFKTKEKKGPGRKTKKQKEPEFLSQEFKVPLFQNLSQFSHLRFFFILLYIVSKNRKL